MIDLTETFGKLARALSGKSFAVCTPLKSGFNPAAWGDDWVLEETNCYTYALNCPQMGWARPGNLRSLFNRCYGDHKITVKNIRDSIKSDGLEELTEREALSGSFYALALRISHHNDYHFYRLDSNGLWSHKLGDDPATTVDDSQRVISNPGNKGISRTYDRFGGYFTIPENGILYVPRLRLPENLIKSFG